MAETWQACRLQVALPPEIRQFVEASTGNYGKVKLVLQKNAFFVESPFPDVLHTLLQVNARPPVSTCHPYFVHTCACVAAFALVYA